MKLTEFVVTGGKAVDPTKWVKKLSEHGFIFELDPAFDLFAHEQFVRVRFAHPGQKVASDVGFDIGLTMPAPDLAADRFAKVVARYEQMLANLRASKLPPSFAESTAKKIVELKARNQEQAIRFRVEAKDSRPGDYAAAAMAAAAYAAVAGGKLNDHSGNYYQGEAALAAMAKSKWLDMPGKDVAFEGWDAAAESTPAKQPAAPKKKPVSKTKPKKPKPVTKRSAAKTRR